MKPTKTCLRCGRVIEWRKAWEKNWDSIRYCSEDCRRHRLSESDRKLETAILGLLEKRSGGSTICPSEAARDVFPTGWQEYMEDARRAARRLVASEQIEITQGGQVVDPSTAKGPIRLRMKSPRI